MLFYHRFSGFPSSFLRNTHARSPPYLSLPSFVFILMPESQQHVRFVYNGNLTLPSWLMLRLRARTDLKTRGWQPSGLQSQFNLAKAQREFSLPFAAPPPISPSFALFSSGGDREGDWGAEALIGSITAQMRQPDASKSRPLFCTAHAQFVSMQQLLHHKHKCFHFFLLCFTSALNIWGVKMTVWSIIVFVTKV